MTKPTLDKYVPYEAKHWHFNKKGTFYRVKAVRQPPRIPKKQPPKKKPVVTVLKEESESEAEDIEEIISD